jgi:FHS family L-fucose permease-like MFS transporter
MMGNMMNFLAYAIMGIPAGKMLSKYGYKKTALIAIAVGFAGVFVQFLSGIVGVGSTLAGLPSNFFVYLLGAFIAGFAMCMLNTVVNPMLKLMGGERSNQYIQIGGSFNSLMGTLTPMLVGSLIGTLTKDSLIKDVNPVLFLAMGVFAFAFIVLMFVNIQDPEAVKDAEHAVSPLKFKHFVLGVIAIFVYVGVEVGIPGTLNFYLSDSVNGAGMDPSTAVAIAGFVAGTYWLLMLVGRLCSSFIADKVSSKTMMIVTNGVGMILILLAIFIPKTVMTSMPLFTGSSFAMTEVPVSAMLLVLCGLCTSIMWASIFNLATEGLGKYTAQASGIFMMMVVGGGVMPLIQNFIADSLGYMISYIIPLLSMGYMFWYALVGSKNVNPEIPVD